jgi:hypothetical protein
MRKYGFSFSWRRAIGLSAAKGRLSRQIGIPLTRSGRQRKMGRAMGCCVPLAMLIGCVAGIGGNFVRTDWIESPIVIGSSQSPKKNAVSPFRNWRRVLSLR